MSSSRVAPEALATGRPAGQAAAPGALRLALTPIEAAEALGVSRDFFDHHILPELRIVRRGRRRLIPVRELERWLDKHASRALGSGVA